MQMFYELFLLKMKELTFEIKSDMNAFYRTFLR